MKKDNYDLCEEVLGGVLVLDLTRVATVQRSSKAEKSTGEWISRATEDIHETDGGEGNETGAHREEETRLLQRTKPSALRPGGFAV
jgi:hypothetical protein